MSVFRRAAGTYRHMGLVAAAVLPLTALVGIVVAITRPLGSDSVMLVVGALAAAGIVLTCAGFLQSRR
jgi:hypothetical protein